MPLLDYVDPETAPSNVQEILEDHKHVNGRYSLFERVLANNPEILEARVNYYKTMIHEGNLDRRVKELAHITTSLTTGCDYCASSHTEKIVETVGAPQELLSAVANNELGELSDRDRAVVELTRQAVSNPHRVNEEHIENLHEVGFADEDIIELLALVAHAIGSNTIVDALNVDPADFDESLPTYHPEKASPP